MIGAEGEQIGIKPLPEALNMASEQDLDLVEVASNSNPPVCRIMDYGKYKYEASQRDKESRKKATQVVVKEMKYRPKIGKGDFTTKTNKVEHFLMEGNKVKVTIMFRGREMQHPELGRKILDQVAEVVAHAGAVEVYPKQDGRNMIMVLGPDKKAQAAWLAEKEAEAEAEAAALVAEETPDTTVEEAVVEEVVEEAPVAAEEAAVTPVAAEEAVETPVAAEEAVETADTATSEEE